MALNSMASPSVTPVELIEKARQQLDTEVAALENRKSTLINARNQIDREIVIVNNTKHTLQSRRNALSITSRLPSEMLSHIFILNAQSHYANTLLTYPTRVTRRGLDWINVSHVCYYWRELAINTPRLWLYLPLHLPRWTEEMLLRSKPIPVIYELDLRYPQSFVIDRERVGEIHLRAEDFDMQRHCDTALASATPLAQLRRLLFARHESRPPWDANSIDLSALNTPNLQRLDSQFSIQGLRAPQLKHLHIWDVSDDVRLTISLLLNILSGLPLLETLCLGNAFNRPSAIPIDAFDATVTVPNLRLLQFTLSGRNCSYLLNHINPSMNMSALDTTCTAPYPLFGVSAALAAIQVHTSAISRQNWLRTIWIQVSFSPEQQDHDWTIQCNLVLKGWSQLLDKDMSDESSLPKISLNLSWDFDSSDEDFGSLLISLCVIVANTEVEIVHVDFCDNDFVHGWVDIPQSVWVAALKDMPVKTLRISCRGNGQMTLVKGLLLAVQGDDGSSMTEAVVACTSDLDARRGAILPALQKVVLHGVDLTSNMDSGVEPQEFFDVLPTILSGQTRIPSSMELHIEHCLNVTGKQITQLKEIVGVVVWDSEEVRGF